MWNFGFPKGFFNILLILAAVGILAGGYLLIKIILWLFIHVHIY